MLLLRGINSISALLGRKSGEFSCSNEDPGKHCAVQPAGIGISQRRMIAAKQVEAIRQKVLSAVRETKVRFALDGCSRGEIRQIAIEGDLAKADDDANVLQGFDLGVQMCRAVSDLLRSGLVAGRRTANDGGDPGFTQLESIVARRSFRLIGEAGLVEHGIHEISGAVAREGSSGAVGSMGSRREAENKHTSPRIAKARHRTRPVDLISVCPAFCLSNRFAIGAKTRTSLAGRDGLMNLKNICCLPGS